MIPAQYLTLSIVNTQDNTMVINEEFAQRGTINLKYNGGDERYQYMMPSELNFSMEVGDASDLAFRHLFTGNETNYEVVLTNEDDLVIWRGHILPEQYEEPYEHALLYVNFTATDGLARLKGKDLGAGFYQQRWSVIRVITECLKLTNLELPILFAPALKNDSPDIAADWDKIYIDMATYKSDSDKLDDCYKILDALLETLGCSLFCYMDSWYITGHNRYRLPEFSTPVIQYFKYNVDGQTEGFVDMLLEPTRIQLEATPQITLLPPLQLVTSTWDIDEREDVLPDDVIHQPYEELAQWANPPAVLHWVTSNSSINVGREILGPRRLPTSYANYVSSNTQVSDAEAARRAELIGSDAFIAVRNFTVAPVDNTGYYMELENPIFLKSVPDYIDINLTMVGIFGYIDGGGPFGQINEDDYTNDNFNYEILYNGETMISNLPGYVNREGYLLDITFEGTGVGESENPKRIVGKLSLEEMQLPEPGGELQVRIYVLGNPRNNIKGYAVGCSQLSIKYSADDEVVTDVTRDIDWTTQYEIDLEHGDSCNDLSDSHFTLVQSDSNINNYQEQVVLGEQLLTTGFVPPYQIDNYIEVDAASYAALQTAVSTGQTIYGLRSNETVYTEVATTGLPAQMFRQQNGRYYVYLQFVDGTPFVYFFFNGANVGPRLFIYLEQPLEPIPREFRQLWSRVGAPVVNEGARYGEVRCQMVHDTTPATLVKIDSSVFGLLDPWTLTQFDIDGDKAFIITDLSLQLDTGMSSTTMIEVQHDNEVETSYNE